MRPNNIAWSKRKLQCGINFDVVKVQATVGMEINRRHFLDTISNNRRRYKQFAAPRTLRAISDSIEPLQHVP